MGKLIVHGQSSRQWEHRYLQQLQFFAHWSRDILLLFSIRELPYREFELMEAFRDPTPVEQRIQIHLVAGEVWGIFCGMGFCIVDYVLRRGDVLPKNFHWHGST
jgi:hypothetical protein